jgi:Protein of unknown function (DUF1592)/Protein of unknown function (DUF1588)/Protein of unknown function (DUF1587)/Protein of unknown function (DUF1585)/Protein of unknown function (DUF1595)/Planctomycete cytochrome C
MKIMMSPRFIALFMGLGALSALAEAPRAVMPEKHRAFFKSYCLECHNAETQEGKVRLDDLAYEIIDIPNAERWQKILNVLNSGEMPPEDEKQPKQADKTEFLDHLSQTMVTARKTLADQGGVITMRRLNRREYENTIRELLGVQVDVKTLPSDAGSGGFDTAGKSLFFSSDQFEQYLAIARTAIDESLVAGERPVTSKLLRECETGANKSLKNTRDRLLQTQNRIEKISESGDGKNGGFIDANELAFQKKGLVRYLPFHEMVLSHPLSKSGALLTISAGYAQDVTTIPADAPPGDYVLRVRVGVLDESPSEQRFLEVGQGNSDGTSAKAEMALLGCYQVTGTPQQPQTIEIPVTVTKSGNRTFILRQRQHNDRKAMKNFYFATVSKNGVGPAPSLWLDSVEWEGPIIKQWPPASYQAVFGNSSKDDQGAREMVQRFAERAFRGRSVDPLFLDKLMDGYQRKRSSGASFEVAIREPLAIVLASPSFLYIVEPVSDPKASRQLTPVELANRLSYFLWSAPPDAALMARALSGELMQPAVLASEVDRLIADPKAWGFITGFVSQWLHMERLDFFQFNPGRFPTFDHSTRLAARDEVYHSFLTVLRDDLGLKQLLKSDYVVVNALMADYYGIPGVIGPEYRRVSVPAGLPRGGLLGMAAILAMGSDGERSSPVERGAFVMRRLLNAPPPPAPANVPQLSRLEGKALPARELLAAHMEQAQCAQCHRKIDPIGYGLENFNAAGLWRTEELLATPKAKKQKRNSEPKGFPIDPTGQLPDGTTFEDFFGLRDAISTRTDTFTRGLTEALIEYALGRPFGFADEDLADKLMADSKKNDYQFRQIIQSLVASEAFHTK